MFTLKRHIRIGAEDWIEVPEDSQVDVLVTFQSAKIDPSYVSYCAAKLHQMLDQSSPELKAKILKELSESG